MPSKDPDSFVICARSRRFVFASRVLRYPFPVLSAQNFGSGGARPPGAIPNWQEFPRFLGRLPRKWLIQREMWI
jgi:hypothetical protein